MKIFLSHSTKDRSIVNQICEFLSSNQIETYIAEDEPEPGRRLDEKIHQHILEASFFLVVLTKNGDRSKLVREEIGIAIGLKKNIIPIVENGTKIESLLEGREYIPLDPEKPEEAIEKSREFIFKTQSQTVIETTDDTAELSLLFSVLACTISIIALILILSMKSK